MIRDIHMLSGDIPLNAELEIGDWRLKIINWKLQNGRKG